MRVADLKDELFKKCQDISKDYSVKIDTGSNFVAFTIDSHKVFIKKIDEILWGLRLVEISEVRYIDSNSTRVLRNLIIAAVEYWYKHAQLKKVNGVIVLSSRFSESYFSHLIDGQFKIGDMGIHHILKEIVAERIKGYASGSEFVGGYIPLELIEKVRKFRIARDILEEVIEENPLVIPQSKDDFRNDILRLFDEDEEGLLLNYHAQELSIGLRNDFKQLKVVKLDRNQIEEADFSKENLLAILSETETENRVKTLLKPPMDNFESVINKAVSMFADKENLSFMFDQLIYEFGSWEDVETEFGTLLKNPNYKVIYDIKDNAQHKEIKVVGLVSEKYYYYFVTNTREKDGAQDLSIYYSTEDNLEEVDTYVTNFLLNR